MFNNFVVTIRKWIGLPGEEVWNLLRWIHPNAHLEIDNPNVLVASATYDGKPVAYLTAEPVYLVSSVALAPTTTPKNEEEAGQAIQSVLDDAARNAGIGRFLVVVPEGAPKIAGERTLRFVERKLPQEIIFTSEGSSITKRLSVSADQTTAAWVN